jgi:hypothetical protein
MQQAIDMGIVGAIKIKDGLFIGDEFSAQVISRKTHHRT